VTHSLHRRPPVSLATQDFVLLLTPSDRFSIRAARRAVTTLLDDVRRAGPVNIGSYGAGSLLGGSDWENVRRAIIQDGRLRCCFASGSELAQLLRVIEGRDLGVSVVVAGTRSHVLDVIGRAGLTPHTENRSCGVYGEGRRDGSGWVDAITSQCGHGMITPQLVKHVASRLSSGEWTEREAIEALARPCVCGIFNPEISARILRAHGEEALGRGDDQG
jgi:hypothetical protein